MPALQNLVITDRQGAPVSVTLTPDGEKDGFYTVAAADASGVGISKKRLSLLRRVSGNRIRTIEKWAFPTMVTEVINGVSVPKVARTAYVDIVWNFDSTHLESERRDVIGYVHSAHNVGKTLTEDTIQKDQSVY